MFTAAVFIVIRNAVAVILNAVKDPVVAVACS